MKNNHFKLGGDLMMKKNRQLHLWIGLTCSLFILVQSITGLLVTEPWLIGKRDEHRNHTNQQVISTSDHGSISSAKNGQSDQKDNQNNLLHIIKDLHEGKIGEVNVKIFIDISAVAMILLTITGIILSIKTLQAQNKSLKRKKNKASINLKMNA
jgi:hypothetical protein